MTPQQERERVAMEFSNSRGNLSGGTYERECFESHLAGQAVADERLSVVTRALEKLLGAARDCLINDREERDECIESMREDIDNADEALKQIRGGG